MQSTTPAPWQKQGLIFDPTGKLGWGESHAAIPFALPLDDERVRVYFGSRDAEGRSQIGAFDVDPTNPAVIANVTKAPLIRYGALGTFDDRGISAACVVRWQGRLYQYYSGWSLGVTVPFYFYIGLAISNDGGETFHKVSQAPVLGRNAVDPYLTASPYVLIEDDLWRMWYVSGVGWKIENGQPKHYYHIKYAESRNGIDWRNDGRVCIDFASDDEYAIARPSVLKDGNRYRMWYSYRGEAYRLGYAESSDGLEWERKDHLAGLHPSAAGWDSEMIAYAHVFDHPAVEKREQRYMLYNGNGYGASGIGLAKYVPVQGSV